MKTGWFKPLLFSVVTLVASCMLIVVLLALVSSTGFNFRSLTLALAAAMVPTLVYGAAVLWLDRTDPGSWELRGLTFFWGAVVAVFVALWLNTAAWSIFTLASDRDTGSILTAVIAAPLVEESAKGLLVAIVLWFTRRHIDGMLDGMVLGALVGLGFAMTENVTYFGSAYADGGATAVGSLFVIRCVINGMGHAVWTSFTGAAIGWSRARHGRGALRMIVPVIGWAAAVAGHALWNLCASIAIGVLSIGLERVLFFPEWKALIVAGIIGGLPFSLPPLVTAIIFAKLGHEQEESIVRHFLPIEIRLGTLTAEEVRAITDPVTRKQSLQGAMRLGGRRRKRQQKRFNELATRLAYFHYHAIRGERPYMPEIRRAEQHRWSLCALRWSMVDQPVRA